MKPQKDLQSTNSDVSFKILMPAHNEAAIIETTLMCLIAELGTSNAKDILLIADNCSDQTAALARRSGVTVLERYNPTQRGKGYALEYGIEHLRKAKPPQVLVMLDADCETSRSDLNELINQVHLQQQPGQMIYLMRVNPQAGVKQKIAGFAWRLKNQLRPTAMQALGMPITLTGTGMGFPWSVIDKVKIAQGHLVEDMQLGIDCALVGHPPFLVTEAYVYSDFPEQAGAENSQRTRWEHGHLQTILQQVPELFKAAWRQKQWSLLVLALDIGVPPLSLLVMLSVTGWLLLTMSIAFGQPITPWLILSATFALFTGVLTLIWQNYGQNYLSATELAGIPRYIGAKLAIYFAFIFKRQKEWVRTDRDV